MSGEIRKRQATDEDMLFMFAVMKASLKPYVEESYGPWDDTRQRRHFTDGTDPTTHEILLKDDVPVGLLQVAVEARSVVVNRIYILPEFQNIGIGRTVMEEVMDDARRRGCSVRLQVFRVNHPAIYFYERLGFYSTGHTDTHWQMEWTP